jgi:exodeoxyribonuclease VII small subunit
MAKSSAPLGLKHATGKTEVRACSANPRGGTFAELSRRASFYFAFREEIAVACAVLSAYAFCSITRSSAGDSGRYNPALSRKSPFSPSEAVLNSSVFPMSSKPKPREAELNFEGAMDRLEKIVEQMESGKLPLEDLIVRYEEGMKLVKICQERLANAEQKIEIITRNSAGKAVVQEFESAQEAGPPAKTAVESESTDDEIKLF